MFFEVLATSIMMILISCEKWQQFFRDSRTRKLDWYKITGHSLFVTRVTMKRSWRKSSACADKQRTRKKQVLATRV